LQRIADALVDATDHALYAAKHAGRNCVKGSVEPALIPA